MRASTTIVLAVCLLTGCEWRSYELELTPDAGGLRRQLSTQIVTREQGDGVRPVTPEELDRIAAEYDQLPPRTRGPKHSFARTFRDRMPVDIGGHGVFEEFKSEFGTSRIYLERFRGDDDYVAGIDRARAAMRRICELLVVWVDHAWANQPEHAAMRRFVDVELKRDLENLAFLWYHAQMSGGALRTSETEDGEGWQLFEELTGRALHYLVEHEYIELKQVPQLIRLTAESEERRSQILFNLCQEAVRRKLHIAADVPLPPSLAILADEPRLCKSLNESLRDCREYQAKRTEWERTPPDERPEEPEEPLRVLSDLLGDGLRVPSFLGRDTLDAKLHAAEKPIMTNGQWDAEQRVVKWRNKLPTVAESHDVPSTYAWAFWAEPNDEAQRLKFGGVTLRDLSLVQYCSWRRSLNAEESKLWTALLESSTSGEALRERVDKFRFPGEAAEQVDCLSQYGRQLLLKALDAKK